MVLSGLFDLHWWAYPLAALGLAHATIVAVTITRVLWSGVLLYVRESRDREIVERYGRGTPNDWIETHLYARCPYCGLIAMGVADVVEFGIGWGLFVFAIQMVWIPFWAAGVINGLGHHWGYRNYPVEDASTNLSPIGVLIGGRLLETLRLARVNRLAPVPRFNPDKTECDAETLRAIITHLDYVLAQYTRLVRDECRQEIGRLEGRAAVRGDDGIDAISAAKLLRWLHLHTWDRTARRPLAFDPVSRKAQLLQTVYSMRQELSALWSRSSSDRASPTSRWGSCVTGARAPIPPESPRCASLRAAWRIWSDPAAEQP